MSALSSLAYGGLSCQKSLCPTYSRTDDTPHDRLPVFRAQLICFRLNLMQLQVRQELREIGFAVAVASMRVENKPAIYAIP